MESFCGFNSALILEWNVPPWCSKVAAIPLEATASAICFVSAMVLTIYNSVLQIGLSSSTSCIQQDTKRFPIPEGLNNCVSHYVFVNVSAWRGTGMLVF